MNPLRQMLRALMTASLPPSRWLVRGPGTTPTLALTFDDGPHPEFTPQVLDALARWHLRATFFVVGQAAADHPYLIDQILSAGHAIGNHTWSHGEPRQTSTSQFLNEVQRTSAWLTEHANSTPRWMRPPKGELTPGKLLGLWRQQLSVALWNVDPKDFRMHSLADVQAWCSQYRPHAGDVVLLHDRLPWAAAMIDQLGQDGLFARFRTVLLDDWIPAAKSVSPGLTAASLR